MGGWLTVLLIGLAVGVAGASYASYRRHSRRAAAASRAAHARLAMELQLALQEQTDPDAKPESGVEVGEFPEETDPGRVT